MTADAEDDLVVAQANEPLDGGRFINAKVAVRYRELITEMERERSTSWACRQDGGIYSSSPYSVLENDGVTALMGFNAAAGRSAFGAGGSVIGGMSTRWRWTRARA